MNKRLFYFGTALFFIGLCDSVFAQSARYSQYGQLNTPTVNFSTYQPQSIQFESPNTSILQNSLRRFEERQNRAYEKIAEFEEYSSSIFKKIPLGDTETMNWFTSLHSKYRKLLDECINRGDYGDAARKAVDYTMELMRNREIDTRINKWKETHE